MNVQMQSGVQSRILKDEDLKNTVQWQLQAARPLRLEINTKNKNKDWNVCLFLARQLPMGQCTRFLDHTQRRATVGGTHLDE
jgi:hypothetical protein